MRKLENIMIVSFVVAILLTSIVTIKKINSGIIQTAVHTVVK